MIPSIGHGMPVSQGSTIVWYVQTGTYGTTWPAIYEDFELPIVCGLSGLGVIRCRCKGPKIE